MPSKHSQAAQKCVLLRYLTPCAKALWGGSTTLPTSLSYSMTHTALPPRSEGCFPTQKTRGKDSLVAQTCSTVLTGVRLPYPSCRAQLLFRKTAHCKLCPATPCPTQSTEISVVLLASACACAEIHHIFQPQHTCATQNLDEWLLNLT